MRHAPSWWERRREVPDTARDSRARRASHSVRSPATRRQSSPASFASSAHPCTASPSLLRISASGAARLAPQRRPAPAAVGSSSSRRAIDFLCQSTLLAALVSDALAASLRRRERLRTRHIVRARAAAPLLTSRGLAIAAAPPPPHSPRAHLALRLASPPVRACRPQLVAPSRRRSRRFGRSPHRAASVAGPSGSSLSRLSLFSPRLSPPARSDTQRARRESAGAVAELLRSLARSL